MSSENEEILQMIMSLIANSGEAKSNLMEAIQESKSGDFEEAQIKLDAADESILAAHKSQTKLLTKEASGESLELSLLMVHSQDHLMNAITLKDIAIEIVEIHKVLNDELISRK